MSKKKTLLEEGTVRRFMKLANMEAIGSNFVNETYAMVDDDEEMKYDDKPMEEEAMPPMQDDEMEPAPEEEELDVELEADEEEPEAEGEGEEMDMDAGDMGELTLTDEEAEVFLKVADKVRAAMDAAEPAEELPAPDMGGEEMEMDAEMDVEAAPEDEEPEDEPMMEDMVNEVARRVARRIQEMKKSK
jgi:hypothetical protein